jgi:hypothetical protein
VGITRQDEKRLKVEAGVEVWIIGLDQISMPEPGEPSTQTPAKFRAS